MTSPGAEPEPLDLKSVTINQTAVRRLSAAQAHRLRAIAFAIRDGQLVLGSDEPDPILAQAARFLTGLDACVRPVTTDSLRWALERYYPDPRYPDAGQHVEALRESLHRKGLLGIDVLVGLVGEAILAGRDRLRISLPWTVQLELREQPDAVPVVLANAVEDREGFYRQFARLLGHAVAETTDRQGGDNTIPLVFFGDRVYRVAVALYEDEILIDLRSAA